MGRCIATLAFALALPAPAAAGEETCGQGAVQGHVTSVKDGRVFVDIGKADGVEKGMRIAVVPREAAKPHPVYGEPDLCGWSPAVTAIVALDEVGEGESSGPIGRGSAATKGDYAVVTDREPTHAAGFQKGPFAYGNVWDLSLRFRTLISFGTGVGFPMDLFLSYQARVPLRIGIYMSPSLFGASGTSDALAVLGFYFSVSTRFLEIGLGVGGNLSNQLSGAGHEGLALTQIIRVGAEHGVRARIVNTFVWSATPVGDSRSEGPGWDSIFAEFVLPVHARVALFWEGGGGGVTSENFAGRFTTGVHVYLRGTGGPGTVVMPIGLGISAVELQDCEEDMCWGGGSYFGLVIATGLDARF